MHEIDAYVFLINQRNTLIIQNSMEKLERLNRWPINGPFIVHAGV